MSSTVLYHIQGIRQYKLKRFVLEKGKNIFEIEHRHDSDLRRLSPTEILAVALRQFVLTEHLPTLKEVASKE